MTPNFSYDNELREIWRENVAVSKSLVLKEEEEDEKNIVLICIRNKHSCKGYTEIGLHKHICICSCHLRRRHSHQFITKIPDWNNSIGSNTTRNKSRGP